MLEPALKEMLNDKRLEIDFYLKLGHFTLQLIRPDQRVDLP
jgi:hypothetical protein